MIPLAVILSEIMEDNSFFSSLADLDRKPIEKDDFPRRGLNEIMTKCSLIFRNLRMGKY